MTISKETADKLMTQAYGQYYDLVLAFCKNRLRECKDYAEDCVQKTFLFYYDKLLEGEEVKDTKAYLYSIANNVCRKENLYYIRRQTKTADIDTVTEVADPTQDFEILQAAEIDYDELAKVLLSQLTKEEQALF